MAFIPIAIQLLPLIPGLIESVVKVVETIAGAPETPEETRAELTAVSERLREVLEKVKQARLPERV